MATRLAARRLHHGCRRSCFWLITLLPRISRPHNRAFNGRSKEEDLAVAPQHAALASFPETRGLCRMPELRRAQAPASSVRIVRILRRARGDHGAIGDRLARKP